MYVSLRRYRIGSQTSLRSSKKTTSKRCFIL